MIYYFLKNPVDFMIPKPVQKTELGTYDSLLGFKNFNAFERHLYQTWYFSITF